MPVTIPPILVLIVCKTIAAGDPDQNSDFTHWQNLEWATVNSMMVCRRQEVELFDQAEGMQQKMGDDPVPPLSPNLFERGQCARAAMQMGMDWDQRHSSGKWRVWRVGCPSPIVNQRGELVGYKLPECGHRDTVICETDSAI